MSLHWPAPSSAPLRIAHLVGVTTWGGLEARAIETARWQADAGHSVIVVAPPGSSTLREAVDRGLKTVEASFERHSFWADLSRIRRAVSKARIQVIDSHSNRDSRFAPGLVDLAALIRTRHTLKLRRNLWLRLRREFPYNRVLVTCEAARRELVESRTLAEKRIDVVGEWAEDRFFAPPAAETARAALRDRLGVGGRAFVIGACGMVREDNAFDELIRATAMLRGRGLDVGCLIVGGPADEGVTDHPQVRALVALANRLGVGDAVRFLGRRRDVPELLDAMDVVAVVARHTAQTRVAPEAAARGKPVVGFSVGAVPEVVQDGRTGHLVPGGDLAGFTAGLERLLRDGDHREALGRAAAAFAHAHLRQAPKMRATLASYQRAIDHRMLGVGLPLRRYGLESVPADRAVDIGVL